VDLPLHPPFVHLPLGLSVLLPFLVGGLAWLVRKRRAGRGAWLLVIGLQVLLVGSAVTATITGERDGRQVERVTGRGPIDTHEDAAQLFLLAAFLGLGLLIAALAMKQRAFVLTLAATALALLTAGLGARTGYRGGELVYRHGAAGAHEVSGRRPVPGGPGSGPGRRGPNSQTGNAVTRP